ncbi:unnamed protein product [Darwinula stevensoni]|uniref:HMG box domain-containing protein n=1 Tax=Darwinula stevensoni TaxID=69355 RepID=A0A7R9A1Y0_9CRUS|nr:unnamed protein product [Darwinula stevensoni]CAG0878545.1 unnamed protein product [Darwinula stevensoni]
MAALYGTSMRKACFACRNLIPGVRNSLSLTPSWEKSHPLPLSNQTQALLYSAFPVRTFSSSLVCGIGQKKSLESMLGLPEPPQRPHTPYFNFWLQKRIELIHEDPELSPREVTRQIAEMWREMSVEKRAKYEGGYQEAQRQFKEKLQAYYEGISEEDKARLREERHKMRVQRQVRKQKSELRQKMKELEKPKRPKTAFALYIQSKTDIAPRKPGDSNFLKQRAAEWNAMSNEEKFSYVEESQKAKARYEKEIRSWEEEMVKQGHVDVVRGKARLDSSIGEETHKEEDKGKKKKKKEKGEEAEGKRG